jgi:predicted glutamine amidotransferase
LEGSHICGLVGYISSAPKMYGIKKREILSQLLYADTMRGFDSTGIYVVNEDNTKLFYKRALAGYDFIQTKTYNSIMMKNDPSVVLGHNRLATHGEVSDDNAHPFKDRHIVLTHNGVVNGYVKKDFDVDSKWIAYLLAEEGTAGLAKVQGNFALVWYNTNTNCVHFCRNEGRTFFYAVCRAQNTIFYASEKGMLEWILNREGAVVDEMCEVQPGIVYTIPHSTLEVTQAPVEFYKAPVYQNNFHSRRNYSGPYDKRDNEDVWGWDASTRTYRQPTGDNSSKKEIAIISPTAHLSQQTISEEALKQLGFNLKSEIAVFINDIYSKGGVRYCEMILANPCKEHAGKDITIKYFFKEEQEKMLYEHLGDTIIVGIDKCRSVSKSNKYVIYADRIIKIIPADLVADLDSITPEEKSNADQEVLDLPVFPGYNGRLISIKQFNEYTKHGCGVCASDITEHDVYSVSWFNDSTPLCIECTAGFKEIDAGEGYANQ